MRNKIALLAVFAAFLLWAVGVGAAQQAQNLQITQGPRVESTTATSATIAWSTNANASTILKYGTDRNNLSQTAEAPWGGLTHRVTIKNLQPNTTYYFDVESTQGQGTGTGALSGVSQFKTQNGPAGASNQPNPSQPAAGSANFAVVGGPIPQDVTDHSVNLWWETNQSVTGSTVKYGTSPTALQSQVGAQDQPGGMAHSAMLNNLQPNATYYYSIVRSDGQVSSNGSFRTAAPNYAQNKAVDVTQGPMLNYISDHSAEVIWQTSAPASTIVRYGTSPNALNQTAEAPWGSKDHRVMINNLQPNTQYFFQVQSGQAQGSGTMAEMGPFPFKTVPPNASALRLPLPPWWTGR